MAATHYPFPSDTVHPNKKIKKEWGLKAAKAIWSHNDTYGPSLFYNERDSYQTYLKYFRGEQDVDQYKPSIGINPRDARSTFVGGIRWQIKNYATKRVNIAVSKVANREYDPIASAIDPLSIERREDYKANIKVFMEHQEFLADLQKMTGVNALPQGMSLDELPLNDEDLKIHMQNDHKFDDEVDLELGIAYHLKRNEFELVKARFDFDFFVLGVGGAYVGMDSNAMPTVKYLDPARIIVPRSEDPSYSRVKYVGYFDEYTVAEFRKLHGGEIGEEEEKRIVEEFAKKGGDYDYNTDTYEENNVKQDVDKIKVLHFEIESTDDHVLLEKPDKAGNMRLHEKDYDYYKTKEQQSKFRERYKTERKLHRKPYKCFYSGYWVIGSETIFGYGKKTNNTGRLGYKLFAPNMRNNKTVSTLKQMIPSLDQLETYDKKIQQVVASAIPKGVRINLAALENAAFKLDGKDMQPQDLIQLFFQRGILIENSGDEQYGQGNGYKPIEELENGMANDIVHYMNLIQQELANLDEIIGINKVTAASSLHQDTGKAVAQQMEMNTEVALDYLYKADFYLTKKLYEELGDLHIQSVRWNDTSVYEGIFGKTSIQRMKENFNRFKYGIDIEARPTRQEWNEFYLDLKEYVKAGLIQPEDYTLIRRINNLKQAEAHLRVTMKRRRKEAQEAEMAKIQANLQGQAQSNEQAFNNNLKLEDVKGKSKVLALQEERKTKALEHKWRMEEIYAEGDIDRRNKLRFIEQEGDEKIDQIERKGAIDKTLKGEKQT